MKITNIFVIILLCIIPTLLHAQAPGYIGKRTFVSFGISAGMAIDGPTQNNNGSEFFGDTNQRSWGLNYEFEGNVSYVIGRYSTLGITVGQYYTGAISEARTLSPFFNPISSSGQFDNHELFHRLNVRSISLSHSIYKKKKGALAPYGNYFFYGLGRKFISAEIIDKKTDYWAGEVFGNTELGIDSNIEYTPIFIGWASHQIFWDRVLLKVGIKISFPLNYSSWQESINENTNQSNYSSEAFSRIYKHEVARFDIGVGYLLF